MTATDDIEILNMLLHPHAPQYSAKAIGQTNVLSIDPRKCATAQPDAGENEKGELKMREEEVNRDAEASNSRALFSVSARVPLLRGHPVGGRWRERGCTESVSLLLYGEFCDMSELEPREEI